MPRSVLEPNHLPLIGPCASDADRRTIKRREECRARHFGADFVEHRLKAKVNPGRRCRVVVGGKVQLRFEQLDERPRIADLRVGHRVHLVGNDKTSTGPSFSARARTPGVMGPELPMSTALKPEGSTNANASVPSVITFGSKVPSACTRASSLVSSSVNAGESFLYRLLYIPMRPAWIVEC